MNIHCVHDSPVIWRKRVVLDRILKIANYTAYEQVGETLRFAIVSSFVHAFSCFVDVAMTTMYIRLHRVQYYSNFG